MMARRPDARYANMMMARYHMRALAQATWTRLAPARTGTDSFEIGRARVSFEVGDLSTVETDAIADLDSAAPEQGGVLDRLA
jgi:hypothetical protein